MIDFDKDYILENDFIKLTPLKENDFDKLSSFSIDEPELWTYSLIQANSPEKMKIYIDKAIEGRKNKNTYAFIVFDKRKNKFAGSNDFMIFKSITPHYNSVLLGMAKNFKEPD